MTKSVGSGEIDDEGQVGRLEDGLLFDEAMQEALNVGGASIVDQDATPLSASVVVEKEVEQVVGAALEHGGHDLDPPAQVDLGRDT